MIVLHIKVGLRVFDQVVMLSSVTELHAYIDPGQLTTELGGTQEYCHDSWISHRTVRTHTHTHTALSSDVFQLAKLALRSQQHI